MSSFLQQQHIVVSTVLTTDGISPVVIDDVIQYKETHLPLTAKKMLDKKNEKLPDSLKMKIKIVEGEAPGTPQEKKGPGRPPKNTLITQQP